MKNKLLPLMIVALFMPLSLFAHDFEVGGIYFNITSNTDKTVEVTSGEYTGSVVIPETVTYSGTTYSVTSIGHGAFYGCSGLTSVTIGNSVTSIGDSVFAGCTGLTSVTIGNSVTSIGVLAFSSCDGLISITIPNSITSIGDSAFSGCSGLTSITVAEDNKVYDSRENCNAIIETATNALIAGCMNTVIPNSVTSIGVYAFCDCDGLTSITIPNSVTSIGNNAFRYCDGLASVTIGNSVTRIDHRAFEGCTGLTSVTIPNSVTSIGREAFLGCSGLTSVIIGNSVTSIGDYAFRSYKLKDIYAYPLVPPTIDSNTFLTHTYDHATLHVVKGYKQEYYKATNWSKFYNVTDDLTGVEGVKVDETFSITVAGGTLSITGAADDAVVNIYNTNGVLLHHTTAAQASGIALPSGIYLVQVNGATQKVAM